MGRTVTLFCFAFSWANGEEEEKRPKARQLGVYSLAALPRLQVADNAVAPDWVSSAVGFPLSRLWTKVPKVGGRDFLKQASQSRMQVRLVSKRRAHGAPAPWDESAIQFPMPGPSRLLLLLL